MKIEFKMNCLEVEFETSSDDSIIALFTYKTDVLTFQKTATIFSKNIEFNVINCWMALINKKFEGLEDTDILEFEGKYVIPIFYNDKTDTSFVYFQTVYGRIPTTYFMDGDMFKVTKEIQNDTEIKIRVPYENCKQAFEKVVNYLQEKLKD